MLKPALLTGVLAAWLPLCGQVKITQETDKVAVEIDGKPFTDFVIQGEDYAKPYLWPLRAASGTVVTRYWPIDKTHQGESTDHPHHRGLWFGEDEVNGFNFWANEPSVNQKNREAGRNESQSEEREKAGRSSAISNGLAAAMSCWSSTAL